MSRKMKLRGAVLSFLALGAVAVGFTISNNGKLSSFSSINASVLRSIDEETGTPFSTDTIYESEYDSKAEALQAGLDVNEQISEEGMILVKNENNTLPLITGKGTTSRKVTLLGYAGVDPNAGASLHGGDSSSGNAIAQVTLYQSLVNAGYNVNPTVWNQYNEWFDAGLGSDKAIDTSFEEVSGTSNWTSSINEYSDAAIVVIGPGTGEGLTHFLQLDQEQLDLIDYASNNFDKVIVLINSVIPIEMADIYDNDNVDAILMIGEPGDNGLEAVGKILSGEVNPSGRTSDVWATDFTANPAYVNYNVTNVDAGYAQDGAGTYTGYSQYLVDEETVNTWSVGYEEDIYVGYRWYETAYAEYGTSYNPNGSYTDADNWYEENVVLPFGYGSSYTTFEWDVTPSASDVSSVSSTDTLSFDIRVTNTGDYAGKEVVQLYYSSTYTDYDEQNHVEKSQVNLGDFAKTDLLAPGESQTVRVSIDVSDLASYDYFNAETYILETDATYLISIATDSHSATLDTLSVGTAGNNTETFDYRIDTSEAEEGSNIVRVDVSDSGAEVTNQLDDVTAGFLNGGVPTDSSIQDLVDSNSGYTSLSRSDFDGTLPSSPSQNISLTSDQFEDWIFEIGDYDEYYSDVYDGTTSVTYATSTDGRGDYYSTTLSDVIGLDINDPEVDAIYQDMVEQLTLEELVDFVNTGGFQSMNIDYLGVPLAWNTDGPKGWTGTGTDSEDRFNYFTSAPMFAWTFNKELAYELGEIIGEQGLWGNSTLEDGVVYAYSGWYAPGMNIHRTPFDSRYNEYLSEDPVLTGYIAANISLGAKSKGAYITMKHFAFHNDGGGIMTYRGGEIFGGTRYDGTSVWITEQAAREIYLKGYQITVEEGEADYMMSAFTRLGSTWIGGSYAINTNILRNEWGFDGSSVTDIAIYAMVDAYQLVEAGAGGIMLANYGVSRHVNVDEINAITDEGSKNVLIHSMQETVKHTMYLVANSAAMQIPHGARVVYDTTEQDDLGLSYEITLENAKVGEAYTSINLLRASLNTYTPYSTINYSVTGLPDGLSFDANTGVISGTPTEAGTYYVTVEASAAGYTSASHTFTLVVEESDTAIVETQTDSSSSNTLTTVGIVLIVIGIVAILAAVGLVAFWKFWPKKKEQKTEE